MKVRCLALCAALACSWSVFAADPALNGVTTVYLLPMTGGLDQYLANRLARSGRFHVVTDPAKADAVFTDRLGSDFENTMTELYPPPAPPEKEKSEEEKKKEEDKTVASLLSEASGGGVPRSSTFSRGRGNVFLVDRESRLVLWSHFSRPRNTRPEEIDRVADQIASKLTSEVKALAKDRAKQEKASVVPSLPPAPPPPAEPPKAEEPKAAEPKAEPAKAPPSAPVK